MYNEQKKLNVYVRGLVGNLGTKILIKEKRDTLLNRFNNVYLDKVLTDLEGWSNPPLINLKDSFIEPIGKGGVLTALWDVCDKNKFGLRFSLREIPIIQGVIEISNFFDITPYRLLTENSQIIVTKEEISTDDYFIKKIGETNSGKKRVRIDGEAEAFLTKDYKDEIDKIIINYTKKINKNE